MEKQMISTTSYSHPEIEEHITNLGHELKDFAQLQGKEDAMKEHDLTRSLFITKVKDPIRSKVQMAIDFIRNILLPTSLVFSAAEIEQTAKVSMQVKNNEINDKFQLVASLKRKLNAISIDPIKVRYGKWLTLVAIIVGLGDAALAYISFRHGAYPVAMALISALAVGAVIAISHLFYAGWIKKAEAGRKRMIRIAIILVSAFLFFACVGNLRASASNQTVNIALDGNTVSAASTSHLNGWAIALISFALFTAVFFLSLLLWRTKKERMDEQEHAKVLAEIQQHKAEIKTLQNEIAGIRENANKQKEVARKIFDYAVSSIRKAKSIGANAVILYKQTYARFHNDIVPAFFDEPIGFEYDESFQFPKIQKPEEV
ncbi:MAG: hypothetical protein AAB681_00470 [Patescibacteria group bacterium]